MGKDEGMDAMKEGIFCSYVGLCYAVFSAHLTQLRMQT